MGVSLTTEDESTHTPGPEINWNESRYVDFWDPEGRVGGWFRIGVRPNAGYAEMSACVFLPDERVGFTFGRPEVTGNTLEVADHRGTQRWEIVEPWRTNTVHFEGDLTLFTDPWALTEPQVAFASNPKAPAQVDLVCTTEGLHATMGQDQDQHHLILLPGQAAFHYQHMARVSGTVRVGDDTFAVLGRGGKDHSWGPRDWHAKTYFRWLICCIDDDNGFMLVRAVAPTAERRSGFVWAERSFAVVDGFEMQNRYGGAPHYQLEHTDVTVRARGVTWRASGWPQNAIPARHRQAGPDGREAILRIVKQPTEWTLDDGRRGIGHLEFHDLVEGGVPVGLHE